MSSLIPQRTSLRISAFSRPDPETLCATTCPASSCSKYDAIGVGGEEDMIGGEWKYGCTAQRMSPRRACCRLLRMHQPALSVEEIRHRRAVVVRRGIMRRIGKTP